MTVARKARCAGLPSFRRRVSGRILGLHDEVATTAARGLGAYQMFAYAIHARTVVDQRDGGGGRHRDHVELVAKIVAPATGCLFVLRRNAHSSTPLERRRASWLWMVRTLTPSARAVRVRSLSKWARVRSSISRSICA